MENKIMKRERIEEIKALYIKAYPHLAGIKNERQFFVNAIRLVIPAGISPMEHYRIIREYNL